MVTSSATTRAGVAIEAHCGATCNVEVCLFSEFGCVKCESAPARTAQPAAAHARETEREPAQPTQQPHTRGHTRSLCITVDTRTHSRPYIVLINSLYCTLSTTRRRRQLATSTTVLCIPSLSGRESGTLSSSTRERGESARRRRLNFGLSLPELPESAERTGQLGDLTYFSQLSVTGLPVAGSTRFEHRAGATRHRPKDRGWRQRQPHGPLQASTRPKNTRYGLHV